MFPFPSCNEGDQPSIFKVLCMVSNVKLDTWISPSIHFVYVIIINNNKTWVLNNVGHLSKILYTEKSQILEFQSDTYHTYFHIILLLQRTSKSVRELRASMEFQVFTSCRVKLDMILDRICVCWDFVCWWQGTAPWLMFLTHFWMSVAKALIHKKCHFRYLCCKLDRRNY